MPRRSERLTKKQATVIKPKEGKADKTVKHLKDEVAPDFSRFINTPLLLLALVKKQFDDISLNFAFRSVINGICVDEIPITQADLENAYILLKDNESNWENVLMTVFPAAIKHGNTDLCEWLIEHGAPLNKLSVSKWTLLHLAMLWEQVEIAEILLKHGANANAIANNKPPIALSCMDRYNELVDVLLKYGADLNARNSLGNTALHLVHWINTKFLTKLVNSGADINAPNIDGQTPLHLTATRADCITDLKAFVDFGANVWAVDNEGKTALDLVHESTWLMPDTKKERVRILKEAMEKNKPQSSY